MEILEYTSNTGLIKTQRKILPVLILSLLGGAYIAFASGGSTMAAYNLLANADTYGLGRALAGAVFGTGLMLVVLAGAELFTGNSLIIVSALDRKVTVKAMLLNWLLVYIGNFAGSIFIAMMMYRTGLFNSSSGLLGGITIKIAAYKTALPFHSAFFLGIMCNWLVCLAVWVSYGTSEIAGKALTIFFIIGLFITSGFEHSIANMYYIPAGIFAKQNPQWLAMSKVPTDQIVNLNWISFLVKNLIPVTLGNIVGGSVMVGTLYWLSRELQNKKNTDIKK
ncbi:MAG: formate/nitrite transporter family protein [Spirochaetes bacterium]|nr:formate/nitrite transporter family protein [Spirochaetota bacterium]